MPSSEGPSSPRNLSLGSRAAVVGRLLVRPVCPKLRKRRVASAVTLGANNGYWPCPRAFLGLSVASAIEVVISHSPCRDALPFSRRCRISDMPPGRYGMRRIEITISTARTAEAFKSPTASPPRATCLSKELAIVAPNEPPKGGTESLLTLCWREMDSNFRFRASGDTPQRPRVKPQATASRLPLRRRDPPTGQS
jgi:hypothetical protein